MSQTTDFEDAASVRHGAPALPVQVARQPIFDRQLQIAGYELLHRPLTPANQPFDPQRATASVIITSAVDIGFARLADERPVYINVTRELLLKLPRLPLPPDRVVLELVENQLVDRALIESLSALVDRGFQVALDDFIPTPEQEPLLELASIVKLDLRQWAPGALARQVESLKPRGVSLVAEKVETAAEQAYCLELGFDAFQGYHLARPSLSSGVALPVSGLTDLAALMAVNPKSPLGQLEQVIADNPGLRHRFLRLAGLVPNRPESPLQATREAFIRLGAEAVRHWVELLLLAYGEEQQVRVSRAPVS
jgi:EAL and modified HD-GYP domain-containing signal transduction protein